MGRQLLDRALSAFQLCLDLAGLARIVVLDGLLERRLCTRQLRCDRARISARVAGLRQLRFDLLSQRVQLIELSGCGAVRRRRGTARTATATASTTAAACSARAACAASAA